MKIFLICDISVSMSKEDTAMPNYEPNFYNNQTTGMQAKALHTASKGDPSFR